MENLGRLSLALALLGAVASPCAAGRASPPPPVGEEHLHPSGAFTFRTPAGWKVGAVAGRPELHEATDGTLIVRFLFSDRETGYDSLHTNCMLERLAPEMETAPQIRYEYDFVSWANGDRRVLDSAFEVRYDHLVGGSKEWRQRNLTVVGSGQSLCLITHAPSAVWRRNKAVRALADEIIRSVTFKVPTPPADAPPGDKKR